jgi:histidinol-phosphate aminotransferase
LLGYAIERERPALVLLAYPNNPTGNLFDVAAVEAVLRAAPGMVVVDEAYHAYAGASFLPRLAEFPNLVIVRTVSKIGMAGLRLGYAVAAAEWTTELNKVRQPYNLNALTQAVAPVLLAERALLADQAARIKSERARLGAAFAMQDGVVNFPTQTNFVLVRVNDAEQSRYYIDLKTARVVYSYSAKTWMSRWLYHGLHSLDFPWLYDYRPLWDIVVITFMLGGTALCVTSLILAWRVIGSYLPAG